MDGCGLNKNNSIQTVEVVVKVEVELEKKTILVKGLSGVPNFINKHTYC